MICLCFTGKDVLHLLADFLFEVNVSGSALFGLRLLVFLLRRFGLLLLFLALILLRDTDHLFDLILFLVLIVSVLVLVEHLVHLIKHLLI